MNNFYTVFLTVLILIAFFSIPQSVFAWHVIDFEDDPGVGNIYCPNNNGTNDGHCGTTHADWITGKGISFGGNIPGYIYSAKLHGSAGDTPIVLGYATPNLNNDTDGGIFGGEGLNLFFLEGQASFANVTLTVKPDDTLTGKDEFVDVYAYAKNGTLIKHEQSSFVGVSRSGLLSPHVVSISDSTYDIAQIVITSNPNATAGVYLQSITTDAGEQCIYNTSTTAPPNYIPVMVLFNDKEKNDGMKFINSINGTSVTVQCDSSNLIAAKIDPGKYSTIEKSQYVQAIQKVRQYATQGTDTDNKIRSTTVNLPTLLGGLGFTGNTVKVAVIDTGLDPSNFEFDSSFSGVCHSFTKPSGVANLVKDENSCSDTYGHGTMVAGIIAASRENPLKGVAPNVKYMIYKVSETQETIPDFDPVNYAINRAVTEGADVINISLDTVDYGWDGDNCDGGGQSTTKAAIDNAYNHNIPIIVAVGNKHESPLLLSGSVPYPACFSKVIAVGEVDFTDSLWSDSITGKPMSDHGILAPGVRVHTATIIPVGTPPSPPPLVSTGTSFAAPAVTGVVALMEEKIKNSGQPRPPVSWIKHALFSTTCKSDSTPNCPNIPSTLPDENYGYGRVDAMGAVTAIPEYGSLSFVILLISVMFVLVLRKKLDVFKFQN